MSREKAKELLKNYGANIGSLLDELPLPNLIEVGLDASSKDTAKELYANLSAQGFKVEVDDHSRYSGAVSYTHLDVYKRQGLFCAFPDAEGLYLLAAF